MSWRGLPAEIDYLPEYHSLVAWPRTEGLLTPPARAMRIEPMPAMRES